MSIRSTVSGCHGGTAQWLGGARSREGHLHVFGKELLLLVWQRNVRTYRKFLFCPVFFAFRCVRAAPAAQPAPAELEMNGWSRSNSPGSSRADSPIALSRQLERDEEERRHRRMASAAATSSAPSNKGQESHRK